MIRRIGTAAVVPMTASRPAATGFAGHQPLDEEGKLVERVVL